MSYLIAALTATILLLILAIQNPGPVQIRFLFWHGGLPLAVLIIVATVIGAALVVGASMPGRLRTSRLLHEAERKLQALQDELGQYQRATNVPAQPGQAESADSLPGLHEAAIGLKEPRS